MAVCRLERKRAIVNAFKKSFPNYDAAMMANNLIDCDSHAVAGRAGSYKGFTWLKTFYRATFAKPMPPALYLGARTTYRSYCS